MDTTSHVRQGRGLDADRPGMQPLRQSAQPLSHRQVAQDLAAIMFRRSPRSGDSRLLVVRPDDVPIAGEQGEDPPIAQGRLVPADEFVELLRKMLSSMTFSELASDIAVLRRVDVGGDCGALSCPYRHALRSSDFAGRRMAGPRHPRDVVVAESAAGLSRLVDRCASPLAGSQCSSAAQATVVIEPLNRKHQ